jgi:hypothetical protein
MTPLPVADCFYALNARLLDASSKRRRVFLRGHITTIGARMTADQSAFLPLPPAPYDACQKIATRVSSLLLVRYRQASHKKRSGGFLLAPREWMTIRLALQV